ncbi:MAG: HD domain-containing protein [Deltaproteobacteria bacterium]|nr:HD domain-containing protein [Deltaproteobacteria bacterium]
MRNETSLAKVNQAGPFEGCYRLRRPLVCHTRGGRPFVKMVLEDLSGSIPAYIWGLRDEAELPPDLSCVEVGGLIRMRRDGAVVDLEQVLPIPKPDEEVIRLMPRSLCPLPWQMPFLEKLIEGLQLSWLRRFVMEVLSEDALAFPFIGCPASLRHHHNYPGGLLQHSLECARIMERYVEFPPGEREIGMVGALFHDIGKIRTMTPGMKKTSLGAALDHDKLTLEVLAPYLARVDAVSPEGAAELRYVMTWRPGRQDPGIPKTPLANAVLAADRVSAGVGGG